MKKTMVFIVLIMLLVTTITVYAKTITVDGDGSEWIPAEIVIDDANNDNDGAGQDIDAVYFTNNATMAYFRVDTVGPTDFTGVAIMGICVDSDNDVGTGAIVQNCNNQAGMDLAIVIDPSNICGGGTLMLLDLSSLTPAISVSLSRATLTNVTEVEIALSELGITSADDGMMLPSTSTFRVKKHLIIFMLDLRHTHVL